MSNLESSWEETVVKLAQAGNLRAVAFWLNRHLITEGICVQATTHQPGQLTLQTLCRQPPDRDRLIAFIGQRLSQLNSPVIRSVQLRTQLVGSTELLWTQTVQLVPEPAIAAGVQARPQVDYAQVNYAEVSQRQPQTHPQAHPQEINAGQLPVAVAAPVAITDANPAIAEKPAALSGENPIAPPPKSPKGQPRTGSGRSLQPQSLKRKTARLLKQGQQQVRHSGGQLQRSTERSIRWFQRQKPRQKAVILGSSAIAAFLLGCGFELLRYQITLFTARNQNPEAAATATYEGTVKTAIEQVPVIQLPAANPGNAPITLLFSNAVTLSSAANAEQTGIAAQQNADMLITSLNGSLAGLTPTPSSASGTGNSASQPDAALDFAPEAAGADSDSSALEFPTTGADALSAEGAAPSSSSEANPTAELPPVNLPPLTLQQLQANRVNVVNLASNQLMQFGGNTLTETIKSLSQASIYPIGAGTNQQSARRPQIFSIGGKRIAYLGYSDVSLQTAGLNTAGLNTSVNAQVEADIKSIRDQVDWVIVSYHWNQNLRSYPEDWQIQLTHAAIDHGADLVVGYHPTVTQGAEVYGGRAIVYSLGSMLDPYQAEAADSANQQYETLALKLSLQNQQMQLELLPVRVSGGQTEVLTAETGAAILDYLQQASSLFRQPLRSPTTLDARIRLTLPAAPNSDKPFSAPFTGDPAPIRP